MFPKVSCCHLLLVPLLSFVPYGVHPLSSQPSSLRRAVISSHAAARCYCGAPSSSHERATVRVRRDAFQGAAACVRRPLRHPLFRQPTVPVPSSAGFGAGASATLPRRQLLRPSATNTVTEEEASPSPPSVTISPTGGDEASIREAAGFMMDAFWIAQARDEEEAEDGSSSDPAAVSRLVSDVADDLMDRYGERMGRRRLNSCLLVARDAGDGDGDLLGMVGVEVSILDSDAQTLHNVKESERLITDAVASLRPSERRSYKDSPVRELASELLPPNLTAVAVLSNLAVSPRARRRGIGAKLCAEAEGLVSSRDWGFFDELYLRVEGGNDPARRLYVDALGYGEAWTEVGATALRADLTSGTFVECSRNTLTLKKSIA